MTTKYNQELTDHRNTKNQSEMYKRKKAKYIKEYIQYKIAEIDKMPVGMQLNSLKISHDNHLLDQEIEKIKKEFIEFINERGK